MVKVTFLPDNKTIELGHGSTILDSAYDNGIDIPSLCQMGLCATCTVKVEKGKDLLFENFGDSDLENSVTASNVLSCICELKKECNDGEIIISILENS